MNSLDNTKNILLGNLNNNYSNFKNEIIKSINSGSKDDFYLNFIDKLYSYIPEAYMNKYKTKVFIDLSEKAFNFFKKSHKIFPFLEISSDEDKTHIFILNKDMPFIIDSLLSLLQQEDIQYSLLFHPIIYSNRDYDGNLQSIEDISENEIAESLVIIEIDRVLEPESQESLKVKILKLLNIISETCEVWDPILNKLDAFKIKMEEENNQNQKKVVDFLGWLKSHEIINFLDWIKNNNFTFLGLIEYDQNNKINNLIGSTSSWNQDSQQIADIIKDSKQEINTETPIVFGSLNSLSSINQNRVINYILIKRFDLNKKYIGGLVLLGLYGPSLQYQSIENIPILKNKLDKIIERSGFAKNGYNEKQIKLIIESFPREPLFEIDQENLYLMSMHILSAMATKNLKLFTYSNLSKHFTNLFVFLPSDRMTPITHMQILNYFTEKLKCTIIANNIKEIVEGYSYLRIIIQFSKPINNNFNYESFESDLNNISMPWKDSLIEEINQYQSHKYPKSILQEYAEILPYHYQNKFSPRNTLIDIEYLIGLPQNEGNQFKLINNLNKSYTLKLYSINDVHLSTIMPIIECLGFKVIDEEKFDIENNYKCKICIFKLEGPEISIESSDLICRNIEETLLLIYKGIMPKDNLCKLIIYSGFTWREVMIIKALTSYLRQTAFIYDYVDIQDTLIKHNIFTKYLFNLFDEKLNPESAGVNIKTIKANLLKYLVSVSSASEDKILNSMLSVIEAILRTNNYQQGSDYKDYISFKIDSTKVMDLPLPRPLVEIFVYSNDFEAIHLRGGRVARGGIRWSDRGADFRTEVLGLMKAQMTKNTVIVPVGSKGGFFVKKDLSGMDKKSFMNEIINCYKNFLRGILDITDNIIDKKVILAKNTKILDEPDPYLVVAADKGTASFSDYANSVSQEYNFWLNDAFASGGSDGYDHKKLAITAKGAWIAVTRHFMEMGIDVQKQSISVVGIGDMSGDVFGNGLLRSDQVKLVAAFNHRHIFIDPTPDSLISFKERSRLFELPSSNWSDYDVNLISKGGNVFERSAKSITLSPEIKTLLDIPIDTISSEELIMYILKANVDLIWNGGIGTYIKSCTENHSDIGDKANDNLRVNGNEIRAKVIAEGGNLGVSQLGRIEYSKIGGRINTDFIDNSAGVGCSDSEVNIKIALNEAIKLNKITIEERNIILKQMTEEVANKVLQANIDQTLALTIFEKSNVFTLEMFSKLINNLEKNHGLDRKVEFLPSSKDLINREKNGEKLTRPELSVLLAYSKISVAKQLEATNFSDDEYLEKYLVEYFPKQMREKFLPEILSHQLKKQIINTVITNKIINQLTGTIVNTIQEQTGASIVEIVKYYIVISAIFKTDEMWNDIEALPASLSIDIKIEMLSEINKLIRRGICWLIANNKKLSTIKDLIAEYVHSIEDISSVLSRSLFGTVKDKYDARFKKFIDKSINKNLAHKISILDSFISIFDIIKISNLANCDSNNIAKIYFLVGDKLGLDFLRRYTESSIDNSYWNRLAVQSIKDDIYDMQRTIINIIIKSTEDLTETFDSWFKNNRLNLASYLKFIDDMKEDEIFNINLVILATKKFKNYLKDFI